MHLRRRVFSLNLIKTTEVSLKCGSINFVKCHTLQEEEMSYFARRGGDINLSCMVMHFLVQRNFVQMHVENVNFLKPLRQIWDANEGVKQGTV